MTDPTRRRPVDFIAPPPEPGEPVPCRCVLVPLDRVDGRLRRLTRDPDRWADTDMTRDEWLLLARQYAVAAVLITAFVIAVGVWGPW